MTFIKDNARDIFMRMLEAESEPDMPKNKILDVVLPLLEDLGLSIVIHDNKGNPAVFATSSNPKVLLSGHLDTVNMGSGWTMEHAVEVDGRFYGRGALDMKGPCLSMLLATEELLAQDIGVAMAFTTDEEVGMAGARLMADEHPEISGIPLIIICEPTDLRPVLEEKGLVQFKLVAHGKNAHGSMPEQGRNAIQDLILAVSTLQESGKFGQTSTDPITMNIGIIQGGTLINMVPDHAEAEFDIRYTPDNDGEEILASVRELIGQLDMDCEVRVTRQIRSARSGLSEDMIRGLGDIFTMGDPVPYATEMAVFEELNRNIFILGPGEPGRAHKPDEYMTMEEVYEGARAIVQAVGVNTLIRL